MKSLLPSMLMACTTMISASLAFGGGNISGGGGTSKDLGNPWFIQNTRTVTYCIQHEEGWFSPDLEMQKRVTSEAFAYWKKEFALARRGGDAFQVGTQDFVYKETCYADWPDIHFHFGYVDPYGDVPFYGYVGLSLRRQYDPVLLKANGVVFLAPEVGRYDYMPRNMRVRRPWSLGNGGLFHKALVHELGHVFGLGHTDPSLSKRTIMDATYLTELVQRADLWDAQIENIDSYFGQIESLQAAPTAPHGHGEEFFGVDADASLHYRVLSNRDMELFQVRDAVESPLPFGRITVDSVSLEADPAPAVTLYVTDQNTVFPTSAPEKLLAGPSFPNYSVAGTYRSADDRIFRPVLVHFDSRDGETVTGQIDGKLFRNVLVRRP